MRVESASGAASGSGKRFARQGDDAGPVKCRDKLRISSRKAPGWESPEAMLRLTSEAIPLRMRATGEGQVEGQCQVRSGDKVTVGLGIRVIIYAQKANSYFRPSTLYCPIITSGLWKEPPDNHDLLEHPEQQEVTHNLHCKKASFTL